MMQGSKIRPEVSFFPAPLPDELLDSIVYRYHFLSGNQHSRDTVQTLYGAAVNTAPKLLINRMTTLHSRLPRKLFASPEVMIAELTMVPAFGTVLDQRQMQTAHSASLHGGRLGQNVQYRSATRVMHAALHCCPMCVREETERLGVAYWHRSHQLDGVAVCHAHGCNLISSCPYCDEPISPPGSMKLPSTHCSACKKPLLAVFSSNKAVAEIARLGHQALTGVIPYCDRRWLGDQVTRLVGTDTQRVCDEILGIFGEAYLEDVLPHSFYTFSGDWIDHAFRVRKTWVGYERGFLNLPSLKHMMVLVHFLFGSWEKVCPPSTAKQMVA